MAREETALSVDAVKQDEAEKSGAICCQCDSPHLRRSHFRQTDIGELFRLHWPVRCRDCRERQFVSIFTIPKIKSGQ